MEKRIDTTITFGNLPESPNCHKLAIALEEEITDAVARALVRTYDERIDYNVHVPSF